MQVERAHATRDSLCAALLSTGRVRLTPPQGAFYLFFGVDGVEDSVKAAIDMVDNANVGLAPAALLASAAKASSVSVSAVIRNKWKMLQDGSCAGSKSSNKKAGLTGLIREPQIVSRQPWRPSAERSARN